MLTEMRRKAPSVFPVISIALVSASALALEVLLLRLFSIIQYHHFAYMIISLAMLGYGASGTFLVFFREALLPRFRFAFAANIFLFGIAASGSFLCAQEFAFNPEEFLWTPLHSLSLFSQYILLSLPFFFAANSIALAFSQYGEKIGRIYAADLLGAGVGSIAILLLLFHVSPQKALIIISGIGTASAGVALLELGSPRRLIPILLCLGGLTFPFLVPSSWLPISILPYKSLPQQLNILGSRIIGEASSPLGLITTVASPSVPIRHAPGLSLYAENGPPEQLGLFLDGDAMSVITKETGNTHDYAYLNQVPSALPYHLLRPRNVLILGAGGDDLRQALTSQATRIRVVELNAQLVALLTHDFDRYLGGLYHLPNVTVETGDIRGTIAAGTEEYDLVLLSLFSSSGAGSPHGLRENYLLTVEALQTLVDKLSSSGYLAINFWLRLPPMDALKLLATARESLLNIGVREPRDHLVLIRSIQTVTMMIKKTAIRKEETELIRNFCSERGFDVAYYPGIKSEETNRFNRLGAPLFHEGATALLGDEASSFIGNYKFRIGPSKDDKPFFHHFFTWQGASELISRRDQGGLALMDWSYPVLLLSIAQAGIGGAFLIFLPLAAFGRNRRAPLPTGIVVQVITYFSAIGLAFLFLEIAFMQKCILYVSHPLYAAAAVLAAFLIFAGLGSATVGNEITAWSWERRKNRLWTATIGTFIAATGALFLLPPLFDALIHSSLFIKMAAAVLSLAPLAFFMGMFFPLGLAQVEANCPSLTPWAWGINGCASVISANLATLMAMHAGFRAVILLALGCYAVAALAFSCWRSR